MFGLEAQGDWADLSNQRLSLLNPALSTRTKTSGIGLFTGQVGYAWNASLFYFKGGAAVTDTRFSILDTATGVELAAASATRWGGAVGVGWEYGFAPNWSAGIEYDHLFMGNRNNSFSVLDPHLVGFSQRPDQPGRGYGHAAHQLPLRRLRCAARIEILISTIFDISSKWGRQKCRPFLWANMSGKPGKLPTGSRSREPAAKIR